MSEKLMLGKKVWAVVGVSKDPAKYGNMIYKRLKSRGYEVFAINPTCDTVDGDKCYNNLSSLPKLPEVINMVVSPERAKPVLEEAAKLGVTYIWFQPGTFNDEILEMSKKLGLEAVQACVLVATSYK
ncbi:MAG: CoA-binding protein [Eubacteriales bacterium]|nr:CoA-binding protein [Eubacteriales bacterium]